MQIAITKTDTLAEVDGVPCRLWRGVVVGRGIACAVYVHRIAFPRECDIDELDEQPSPANEADLAPAITAALAVVECDRGGPHG